MTWHRATPSDLPRVTALLDAALPRAMFARSNLDTQGMNGDHPRSMSFWINGDDLLGLSREGTAFPAARAETDWTRLAPMLTGTKLKGVLGAANTVRPLLAALGLGNTRAQHHADEPHFHLMLTALKMPPTDGFTLSPITPDLHDTAVAWRKAYCIETLSLTEAQADERAPDDIEHETKADSHRILLHNGIPVATTGFNARTADMVQIGGVYTPPELRGQGLARKALALHLQEAQRTGATQSVLTSANAFASRAYKSLGYQQIGTFTFWLPETPIPL